MTKVSCIWEAKAVLGEGPTWISHEDALYWVDIKAPSIHRYHPSSKAKHTWPMSEQIGCLVYRHGDGFLAGLKNGFARIKLGKPGEPPTISRISDPEADLPTNRFNDGTLDPYGRFWAGTMDDAERQKTGTWWVLDADDQVTELDRDYQVTNGPAFDVKRNRVYLTDSAAQIVFSAEMRNGGGIENKSQFLKFKDGDGYPDGMTTDAQGNLWIAFWDGACIRKFDPDGQLLRQIDMPVPRPTSIAFGDSRNRVFVTSARTGLSEDELDLYPLSGALFEVELN